VTPSQAFKRRYYEMLMKSQWWSPSQLAEYQRRQLTKLLTHARTTVPFYRERLDAVFRTDGSVDFSRWGEIPIVTRADLLEHREQMLSSAPLDLGKIGTIQSSGSTGDPIKMSVDPLSGWVTQANTWRAHTWHGVDWSKRFLNRVSPRSIADGSSLGSWGPSWLPGSGDGMAHYVSRALPLERLVDLMLEIRPDYLGTTARVTEGIANVVVRRGESLQLDTIFTYGEAATEQDRIVVRATFGARILELYSSKEAGAIGFPCPEGAGFHINAESMFPEIVGKDGLPAEGGEAGRVILTPFTNSALPLIRYDQGDIAVAGAPCPCGRCLPVIDRIAGRTADVFTHPDGRTSQTLIKDKYQDLIGAAKWQVVQTGPTDFLIRYVEKTRKPEASFQEFVAVFRSLYFDDAQLRFERVDDIPFQPSGKYITFINEWSGRPRTRERA
jgi:phenylacetate-CoA ligase